jgi:hypothetical protein
MQCNYGGVWRRLVVEDKEAVKFVVEVSNERSTSGGAYERWDLGSEEALADRMESELGWSSSESQVAASEVVAGLDFQDTDDETGKTVRAYVKQGAVV